MNNNPIRWTRRTMLGATAAALSAPLLAQAPAPNRRSRLILLGTKGGPTPSKARAPAANLLIVDGKPYLIDCPDGTARQLVFAGFSADAIEHIFLTHLHSDHMAGVGALLMLGWGTSLKHAVTVYGPPPVGGVIQGILASAKPDIEYRLLEEGRPDLRKLVRGHEISSAGTLLAGPPVRVTCAPADHYRVPNFAYRFDTPDRSFVFSGDTAPSPALIELARGADVLVHEAMYEPAIGRIADANATTLRDHLLKSHTTTEQLGQVAAAAGVKTLVLSHLVPAFPDITDEMWAEGVRCHFKGEIIIGRDLMEI